MDLETATLLAIIEAQDRASEQIRQAREELARLALEAHAAAVAAQRAGSDIDRSLSGASTRSARAIAQPRDELGRFIRAQGDTENELGRLGGSLGRLQDDLRQTDQETNRFSGSLGRLRQHMSGAASAGGGAAGTIRKIGLAVTAMSGPLSGLLALGPVAIFGGIAAGAAAYTHSIQQAASQGQKLTATQQAMLPVLNMLNTQFHVLAGPAKAAGQYLLHTFQQLAPVFHQAATALAPMIGVLAHGLGGFLTNFLTPMAQALHSIMPVVQVLASGLSQLGGALGKMFATIDFKQAAVGLGQLLSGISQILPVISQLLNALMPVGNMVLKTLVPALVHLVSVIASALQPVLTQLAPVMKPIAETVATLAEVFGQLIQAVAPLIPPILQFFGAFNQLDTPLEAVAGLFADLVNAAKPLLGVVVQIANFLAGFLNTAITELTRVIKPLIPIVMHVGMLLLNMLLRALQQILPALMPLIPPLATLAQSILTALLQVMTALQPVWNQLINAFVQLLPTLVPLIGAVNQLVIALTPILVLVVKLAVHLSGPMITALAKVVGWLAKLATIIIGSVAKAITWLVKNVPQIPKLFVEAFNAVIKFFVHAGTWLYNAGVRVVRGLVDGIGVALNAVWQTFQNIFHNVVGFFVHAGTWLYNAGVQIIQGIINGIGDAASSLWHTLSHLAGGIIHSIGNFLGIGSPSKRAADEIGKWIPAGVAKGIMDNAHLIDKAMIAGVGRRVTGTRIGTLGWSSTIAGGLSAGHGAGGAGNIVIDLRGSQVMTERDMDLLVNKVGRALATRILPGAGLKINRS